MGVPNSQLTTNFVAKYRLITVFFGQLSANCQPHWYPLTCALDTTDTKDLQFVVPSLSMTYPGILQCFSKLSLSGEIFTGKGGFSPAEALFVLGGSAEKK